MQEELKGFLLIDKPSGPTSHDIVDMVRKATGIRKVGHAGTLDPFASGLLLLAVGKATKEISQFVGLDKAYVATLHLGATSDTMDRTGTITESQDSRPRTREEIEAVLGTFVGEIQQVPPMHSAKKIGGRKLYDLARKGIEVEREPRKVMIHGLTLPAFGWPTAVIETHVSSGTYIRALADDIGKTLGCGAYLEELRRTAIGRYQVEESLPADRISADNVRARLFS